MLSEIREHASGWIAWIIATIIVIPFAFWGVHQYFSGGEEVVVASVGDSDIKQDDYRRALENRREQMRQILGKNFDPKLADSPEFKRNVLNDLISQVLLSQHAKEEGYRIGDDQLAQTIRSNPRFQIDKQFSPDAYHGAVTQMGLTETGFESRYRQQLVLQQLSTGIQASSFVSAGQQDALLKLLLQERHFDYAVVKVGGFVDQSVVSEDEIQKEYQSHSQQYRTPEKMKVEYLDLSVDDLVPTVDVTEDDIKQAYEREKDKFTTPAVREASHILIKAGPDASDEEQQAALDKAKDLMKQLRNGADFAELAKKYSQDPGSADKGGDLGRIKSGDMVKPFQDALFALDKEGELAGPVKTRFGYHIIKLTKYEPGKVKPLSEVHDQLEKEVREKRAESVFADRAETFRNVTYEQPQSLEPAADQLGLKIQQSDWFTRDQGTGIAANPKVRKAAFGEDVFTEGLNSAAIELNLNSLVVVRKFDFQPASVKPLKEVHDQIEQLLKHRKAAEHVASLGPELVKQLEGGTAWQKLAADQGLQSRDVTWSRDKTPDDKGPEPAVVQAVFRAPAPENDKAVYGGLSLDDGDYALFKLNTVTDGDLAKASDDLKKRVHDTLARRGSQDAVQEFIADLRDQAEIKIKDEAL